jgi:hypothetical protein
MLAGFPLCPGLEGKDLRGRAASLGMPVIRLAVVLRNGVPGEN